MSNDVIVDVMSYPTRLLIL